GQRALGLGIGPREAASALSQALIAWPNRRSQEVITARADDAGGYDLTCAVLRWIAVGEIDDRVDIRGLAFQFALPHQLMLGRRTVYEDRHVGPDPGRLAGGHDPLLQLHDAVAPPALDRGVDIVGDRMRPGAFFVRVGEHADVVEAGVADEAFQLGEFRLGLAGEADDEGRPQCDAGNPLADP